ncbi:hypothetical protein AB0H42_27225 [Nocardia sp. NPDC050799]|uniref:hypothetical protein n=1 Tax=Nocardia sp. NPDC050799 TaxID=3154842 RepID=UPI0033CEC385
MREFGGLDRVGRTCSQHADILRAVRDEALPLAIALVNSHVLEGKRYVRIALTRERARLEPAPGAPAEPATSVCSAG